MQSEREQFPLEYVEDLAQQARGSSQSISQDIRGGRVYLSEEELAFASSHLANKVNMESMHS